MENRCALEGVCKLKRVVKKGEKYDIIGSMKRHELSEEQWNKIKELLPPERKPQGGRPAKDNRMMLNGIIYWLNTGIPWRDLPERFGPWNSVYSRFNRWTRQGVWEKVFTALIKADIVDESTLMLIVLPSRCISMVRQKKGRRSYRTESRRIDHEGSCCG